MSNALGEMACAVHRPAPSRRITAKRSRCEADQPTLVELLLGERHVILDNIRNE